MKAIAKTIKGREVMLFWIMAVSLLSCFISYVYFLNNAISNVVTRGRLEGEVASLRSEVGNLESRYITLKRSITLDYAENRGFKEVSVSKFITRKPVGAVVSFHNEL